VTEEMKNDYSVRSGNISLGIVSPDKAIPRGYVHLSPEATDQLNRIEAMLKRLIGEDESVSDQSISGWLKSQPDAVVTITEDGRTMYEVDKP